MRELDIAILIQKSVKELLEGNYKGDLYEEVASRLNKEFGISITRQDVKTAAFPVMYGRNR